MRVHTPNTEKTNRKIQHSAKRAPKLAMKHQCRTQKRTRCSKIDEIRIDRNCQQVGYTYREGIDLFFLEGVGIIATHESETEPGGIGESLRREGADGTAGDVDRKARKWWR